MPKDFTITPWEVKEFLSNKEQDPLIRSPKYKVILEEDLINVYRLLSESSLNKNDLNKRYKLECTCRDFILKHLLQKFGNLDQASKIILDYLEYYRGGKYASRIKEKSRIKYNLIEGNINLHFARVISLALSYDEKDSISIYTTILKKSEFLISKNCKIKIPLFDKQLKNDVAYLSGVISGDGHINKRGNEIIICDGAHKIENLLYSRIFLDKIGMLIKKNFNINYTLKRQKTWWVLRCASAFLCRLFNYLCEIPLGSKSHKVKVPKLIQNTKYEGIFWRGIFDTDGYVRTKFKAISFCTKSKQLYKDFIKFSLKNKIKTFHKKDKKIFRSLIAEESMLTFAKSIGLSHPRKQQILLTHLRKGAYYTVPVKKTQLDKYDNIIALLRPYKESVYIKLTTRREIVSKKQVKENLKLIQQNLGVKITEYKKRTKSNHYYIQSKKLADAIRDNYDFVPSWNPLNEKELNELTKEWSLL